MPIGILGFRESSAIFQYLRLERHLEIADAQVLGFVLAYENEAGADLVAGAFEEPKDIPDSVAQARAAAARILGKIARGTIEVDAVFAEIDEQHCSGCRICNELCPYSAIEYDDEKKRSHVISALCKACGACVAACPSSAIKARHFTDAQINAEIEGVLA